MSKSYKYNYSDIDSHPNLFRSLEQGESVTVCGFPYSGKSRLIKHTFEKLGVDQRVEYLSIPEVENVRGEFIQSVSEAHLAGKNIMVVQYLDLDSRKAIEKLRELCEFRQTKKESIQLVFFFNGDIEDYKDELIRCRVLFSNIYYIDLSRSSSQEFFINQNCERYNVELAKEIATEVVRISGGIPILVKQVIKHFAEHSKLPTLDSIVLSPFVQMILDETSLFDIDALRSLSFGRKIDPKKISHLVKTGIIDDVGNITSTAIVEGIKKYKRVYELFFFNNEFVIKGRDISNVFTQTEFSIMKLLFEEIQVSREDLFKVMQGESTEILSEAALDKVMSRIRKKLSSVGVNSEIIITRKGKGYELDKSSQY